MGEVGFVLAQITVLWSSSLRNWSLLNVLCLRTYFVASWPSLCLFIQVEQHASQGFSFPAQAFEFRLKSLYPWNLQEWLSVLANLHFHSEAGRFLRSDCRLILTASRLSLGDPSCLRAPLSSCWQCEWSCQWLHLLFRLLHCYWCHLECT